MAAKPKILVYGAGRHGAEAATIAHQLGWTIVGAYNRSGEKVGRDIGELSANYGHAIGVVVEDSDRIDFKSLDADIAIVAMTDRLEKNLAAYEALLSAGINVICHGSESYFPQARNPLVAKRIDELATANGVSFTGTGVWDHSRIWAGLLATGPAKSIKSLLHKSRTRIDMAPYTDLVGTGLTVEAFEKTIAGASGPLSGLYITIPQIVVHAMGLNVKRVSEHMEPVVYDRPVFCEGFGADVPAGHCIGTRIVADVESSEGVSARAEIELRLFEEGEVDNMEWTINGDPDSDILMTRHDSLRTSTMCMINRVHDVIAAPPGIQLVTDLGPPRFLMNSNKSSLGKRIIDVVKR